MKNWFIFTLLILIGFLLGRIQLLYEGLYPENSDSAMAVMRITAWCDPKLSGTMRYQIADLEDKHNTTRVIFKHSSDLKAFCESEAFRIKAWGESLAPINVPRKESK